MFCINTQFALAFQKKSNKNKDKTETPYYAVLVHLSSIRQRPSLQLSVSMTFVKVNTCLQSLMSKHASHFSEATEEVKGILYNE